MKTQNNQPETVHCPVRCRGVRGATTVTENTKEAILELLGNKYTISMLPLVIFGIGVWNLRRWAVWGIVLVAIANLVFLIANPQIFSGFLVKSEVTAYSIVLSAIVLICNGPLGDIFILVSTPTMLKITTNKQD